MLPHHVGYHHRRSIRHHDAGHRARFETKHTRTNLRNGFKHDHDTPRQHGKRRCKAGDAYTQLPITSDFVSAKMFLNTINPDMVPTQGTAIGRAISTAMNSFTPNEGVDKAIIVITDAENHEDDAVQMAKAAAEKNIKVDVIGIGSLEGVPIPTGNSENNFIKDRDGNVVISKLNESLGQEIAKAGTGIYVRADNTNSALRALTSEVKKMKKADIESKVYSQYDEQFQGLAWIALLLLIVDVFIVDRKNSWLKKITFFS